MSETVDDVRGTIIDVLHGNPKVPRDISGSSRIVEDLALDSLAVMNFVMQVEDRLDVSVPLDRLAELRTVDDLARCVIALRQDG